MGLLIFYRVAYQLQNKWFCGCRNFVGENEDTDDNDNENDNTNH